MEDLTSKQKEQLDVFCKRQIDSYRQCRNCNHGDFSNEIVKIAKARGQSQVEFATLLLQTCKHCALVRFLSYDTIFGAKQ